MSRPVEARLRAHLLLAQPVKLDEHDEMTHLSHSSSDSGVDQEAISWAMAYGRRRAWIFAGGIILDPVEHHLVSKPASKYIDDKLRMPCL